MNKKLLPLLAFLIVAILLGAFTPAGLAAGTPTYDVEIKNENPGTITLTFVGLYVRQFNLPPGKTVVQLERGPYQHSYYGCGQLNFGAYTVKLKDNYLTIENCNKGGGDPEPTNPNEVVFTIYSRSHLNLQVSLVGQQNYVFEVKPGKNVFIAVKGQYQLSYYDCGLLNVETVNIKKDYEYRIKNCQEPEPPDDDPTLRTVTIRNRTFNTFTMNLFGVDNNRDYNLEIRPGPQKFELAQGTYSFSYFVCGDLHFGTLLVTNRGGEIDIYSCSSSLNGQGISNNLVPLKLKNNTGDTVILQLFGNVDYLFAITNGGEEFIVEKGFYQYTIWACGTTFTGVLNVPAAGAILKTPYCPSNN